MSRPSLPSTSGPFDWDAMTSGTDRYWTLTWALVGEMKTRLEVDGILADPDDRCDVRNHARYPRTGTLWTPAIDLAREAE